MCICGALTGAAPVLAVGAGVGAAGIYMQERGQARQQQPPMPAYNQNYSQAQPQATTPFTAAAAVSNAAPPLQAISKDSTNAKAFARCAAACDILGEAEAAAEFRGHASRCEAAAQATRNQRKAEEEQRQEAKRQQREKLAAAQEAERRREELLERERREEALRQAAEDDGKADATAGRLSSMLGLDANLASLGSA